MSLGPIELLVVAAPTDKLKGEVISAIHDLVEKGTIRIVDMLAAIRDDAGDLTVLDLHELGDETVTALQISNSELQDVLSEDDATTFASRLEPGQAVGLLLWENTWATEVADALRRADAQVLVHEPIPRAVVEELVASAAATPSA
jgi:Family of unknown function (DUF6325)